MSDSRADLPRVVHAARHTIDAGKEPDRIAAEGAGNPPLVAADVGRHEQIGSVGPLPLRRGRPVRAAVVVVAHALAGGWREAGEAVRPRVLGGSTETPL